MNTNRLLALGWDADSMIDSLEDQSQLEAKAPWLSPELRKAHKSDTNPTPPRVRQKTLMSLKPEHGNPPSCWGCGHDYMERWSPEDMGPHPSQSDEVVCPDCHEEISSQTESRDDLTNYNIHGKPFKASSDDVHNWIDRINSSLVTQHGYVKSGQSYAPVPNGHDFRHEYTHPDGHKLALIVNYDTYQGGRVDSPLWVHTHADGTEKTGYRDFSLTQHLKKVHSQTEGVKKWLGLESLSRHCEFWKCNKGKWWMDLAHEEYGEHSDSTTYGPFSSQDHADQYLSDAHSNPGSMYVDDSGKRQSPTKSPNGRPVHTPRKSRWGGWESLDGDWEQWHRKQAKSKKVESMSTFKQVAKKHGYFMGDKIGTREHGPGEIWYPNKGTGHVFIFKNRAIHQAKGMHEPLFNNPESHHVSPDSLDKHLSKRKTESLFAVRRSIIEAVTKKEKKPYNAPPEGPKDINPFEIHKYFMGMSDYHEKESRKHGQLGSFKPLFSRDRRNHDNRTKFHDTLQMAFAQKAIDALNFQQEEGGASGPMGGPSKSKKVREGLEALLREMDDLTEAKKGLTAGSLWKGLGGSRQSGKTPVTARDLMMMGGGYPKRETPKVSPETHIRSMHGEKVPPPDAPEDVDPGEWARMLGKKR